MLRSSELLARRGHEVLCATLDRARAPWLTGHGFRMVGLGRGERGFGFAPEAVAAFSRLLEKHDVLLIRGLWQFHIIVGAMALRRFRRRYFVFVHGMLDPWFSQRAPLKHFRKVLFWRAVQHRLLKGAQAVLFTTEEERVLAKGVFRPWGLRERVVSYGTLPPCDAEAIAQQEAFYCKHPTLADRKFLLFLGRLHAKKGCEKLIDAFGAMDSFFFDDLVFGGSGDADYVNSLKVQASRTSLAERIHFLGMLEGAEKWGALRSAEAFVLPSHQENFGIAVAEALACGTPVLISNKVNTHREIAADQAGFVDDPTAEGVSRLLRRYCALDVEARSLMRRKAVECFHKRYNLERNIVDLEMLMQGACG
jgi:glycosyltransferase involved in cell wall biosynthesis